MKKKLPVYNALELRQMADHAASLREPEGDAYFLVWTPEDGLAICPGWKDDPPADALAEFDPSRVQERRPAVRNVTMTPQDGEVTDLTEYDAVFWSESAVEKFLLPYYASESLWAAASVLGVLSKIWYGFVPPLPSTPLHDAARTADTEQEIPFAIAHLPSSEWVAKSEQPGAGLHVLVRKASGRVHHRPFSHYLDR